MWRGAAAALAAAVLGTVGAVLPAVPAQAAPARLVYLTDQSHDALVAYDLSSESVVATVPVGSRPIALAVSPDGGQVWTGNVFGNSLSVVDTATNTAVATLTPGAFPAALAFSPDGARVYVAELNNNRPSVDVIDIATLTVAARIPTPYMVSRFVPSPDATHLYAGMSGTVVTIDPATNAITSSVPTLDGRSISGMALSPDGTTLYAANLNAGTLSVVSTTGDGAHEAAGATASLIRIG
nr:hypothetical protein KitaXyl93_05750 [Kitasatospora sp. Xyl93]